ncbi:MAG: RluA family pseudouridine synthase [Clostridia bacterium]|nr:RluA family pseudouridine synthase [Clostridia bacterium]MBQ9323875.1 RluA family pseudouridine synthase [Clostridia bacterium]MBR0421379.1 RluA family pseudouridine synthase [Clostridia bacterium]
MDIQVLYEDNHLLVVKKPPNVPVQADASGDEDLLTACKGYIKEKYQKPGEVYLGLVHRLDRPVGGVLVFARTSKAAARLTEQFSAHRAQKRYAAVVEGSAPGEGRLFDWLLKNEGTNTTSVVKEGTSGAKAARLSFRTLARDGGSSLLDVDLETGRPHQIRVQLSHAGLPIRGDQRYNPRAKVGEQIRLWAYALTIAHPTLKEEMTFYALPPFDEFPTAVKYLPAFRACSAVYEDADMLVVDKGPGTEVETDLVSELAPLCSPLYPVHRLDANTVGLVVLAKTEAAEAELSEAFARHETGKTYEAILAGVPEKREGTLVHYGLKDEEKSFMRLVAKDTPGALRMELSYRIVETRGGLSKAQIRLVTGRTHQIRVQMAALGCPVLGDDKYGDREANRRHRAKRQLLLSKRLTLAGKTFTSIRELNINDYCKEDL